MIDGRQWFEIEYIMNNYKKIFDNSLIDEDFNISSFEKSFIFSMRKVINEWTINDEERKTLLKDALDSALDDKGLL